MSSSPVFLKGETKVIEEVLKRYVSSLLAIGTSYSCIYRCHLLFPQVSR